MTAEIERPIVALQSTGPGALDSWRARRIILHLGATGTPPEEGVRDFTVGLDGYLGVLRDEYFRFIGDGLSAFKLVVGTYGGGKTHFLLNVKELAFEAGAAVSYLTLNPQESPFDKLDLVYRRITDNLQAPPNEGARPERGMEAFLRAWVDGERGSIEALAAKPRSRKALVDTLVRGLGAIESSSYRNALAGAFRALVDDEEAIFFTLLQYLKGEGGDREILKAHHVFEPIERSTAFRAIRSLAQFVRRIGNNGLVLLLDEAERMVSLASSRNQRTAVDNLRQFIDECGGSALEGVFLFYAIPREELLFGQGGGAVYEALRQRVRGTFRGVNPTGVKIDLESLSLPPTRFLGALAERLVEIYELAYEVSFPREALAPSVDGLVQAAYEQRYGDEGYRRLFVKVFVEALHRLRSDPARVLEDAEIEGIVSGQLGGAGASDDGQEF